MPGPSAADIAAKLGRHGISVSFLTPTATALSKSIIDAIGPFRAYLKQQGFHDYESQEQGVIRRVEAHFVYPTRTVKTTASLYRPVTKDGDPRIWFYDLPTYASAGDLLAITTRAGALYVINASKEGLAETVSQPASPLGELATKSTVLSENAHELIVKLKHVGSMGFVSSLRSGDTGIGFTLESHLGIAANVDRTPDYKGIELKASRVGGGQPNRVNLFSQVPDWRISALRNGRAILDEYGYVRDGRLQLYCTVDHKPNSQGLFFDISSEDHLHSKARKADGKIVDVVCWKADKLVDRLLEKHPETMWVKARTKKGGGGTEEFHFVRAVYTRNPFASSLLTLIGEGIVTMDYTLSLKPGGTTRDHGYLFKISPDLITALFPPPLEFDLTA